MYSGAVFEISQIPIDSAFSLLLCQPMDYHITLYPKRLMINNRRTHKKEKREKSGKKLIYYYYIMYRGPRGSVTQAKQKICDWRPVKPCSLINHMHINLPNLFIN